MLYRLLLVQQLKLKKVQTFKECIVPLLDYIAVSQCDSLTHLQLVKNLWDQESARVVSWNAKMSKFQERISLRLIELEEIEESNMLKQEEKATDLLQYDLQVLQDYFETYVRNVVVYFIKDDDREFMQA